VLKKHLEYYISAVLYVLYMTHFITSSVVALERDYFSPLKVLQHAQYLHNLRCYVPPFMTDIKTPNSLLTSQWEYGAKHSE